MDFPKTADGIMKPANSDDIARDEHGFTHPNLHRRVDAAETVLGETAPREYVIGVFDTIHSTRLTKISVHDEESTTCEVP